jgi:hypothetical protein
VSNGPQAPGEGPRSRHTLQRIGLATASTLIGVNLWTGFPLLAVWVGSRVANGNGLSSGALLVVIVVLVALTILGVKALTWLSGRYDWVTGRPPPKRQVAPWLRAMSGERAEAAHKARVLNTPERIVVACCVVATIAFEVWFFFFAGSSIPNSS